VAISPRRGDRKEVYGGVVRFEWDEVASLVFDDPHVLVFIERIEGGAERWHATGR
jgi:hypothetical protein